MTIRGRQAIAHQRHGNAIAHEILSERRTDTVIVVGKQPETAVDEYQQRWLGIRLGWRIKIKATPPITRRRAGIWNILDHCRPAPNGQIGRSTRMLRQGNQKTTEKSNRDSE